MGRMLRYDAIQRFKALSDEEMESIRESAEPSEWSAVLQIEALRSQS